MDGSEPPRPGLFAIPFGVPFLPALAAHLAARFPDPLALARAHVLLPSNRARRALVEAFLEAAHGRALLLPRLSAIGQIDEDDALGRFADEDGPELPPPIPPLARRLALARFLLPACDGAAVADRLARDLARVLDTLEAHGIAPDRLADLALPDMAAHRERGLRVLEAVTRHWPELLAARGATDPVARRERLLASLAARWAEAPPPAPVIAAGFASAPPSVARLLARIARLPGGAVILPGLDPGIAPDLWEAIGAAPTHPLHGLHRLLSDMGLTPADARPLAGGPTQPDRVAAMAAAFRPAASPAIPRVAPPPGLVLLEAAGPDEEALAIALAMRRALETPGRTAALVTRSRALAARVVAALGRWGLEVDDSAGQPLALRPPGVFLLALADALAARFRPIPLLGVLKHPLAGALSPEARAAWLGHVRALDLALRGPAPAPGLAGISARIGARDPGLLPWWETKVEAPLAGLERPFRETDRPTLAALVRALADCAEALAGDRLWGGADGRALGEFLGAVAAEPEAARLAVAREELVPFLLGHLRDTAVRPPWRRHPRLMILGPLEARLQHADLLILGDMNEGSWPALPAPDPWMAPAVRNALGLPPAEAQIGLEAHDILSATAAPTILLTRARRDAGGPTVPSRFLLRLEAAFGTLPRDAELEAALALDGQERTTPLPRPAPAPPPSERPRAIRVTEADMLAADPFSFYARRMLGLTELDPLEQPVDAIVRGTVVHRILERLVKERPADLEALIAAELAALAGDPALDILWRPRVARMVDWVARQLAARRADGWVHAFAEVKLEARWGGITIQGKADRIDRDAGGRLAIIDYKTGSAPKKKAFVEGHLRQLPLLRLLVEAGGSPEIRGGTVELLEYWKLSGGDTPGKVVGQGWPADRRAFEAALSDLFGRYLFGTAPFWPKVSPVFAKQYRSFDQLARIEEWL